MGKNSVLQRKQIKTMSQALKQGMHQRLVNQTYKNIIKKSLLALAKYLMPPFGGLFCIKDLLNDISFASHAEEGTGNEFLYSSITLIC